VLLCYRGEGDQGATKDTLSYWTNLAKLAEKGKISFIFLADSYNTHDIYGGSSDYMLRAGAHTATLDPFTLIPAMAAVSLCSQCHRVAGLCDKYALQDADGRYR
jgi:alkanesulfonate monooxygenase SsuD/methylene tetrahydromethanopterin reductase-like flavin-dependent oxidoreductase (luciferase family)